MFSLNVILLMFLIVAAVGIYFVKDLMAAAIIFSIHTLIISLIWQRLMAPDLALAEAALGAGVTTVLFLIAISKTGQRSD